MRRRFSRLPLLAYQLLHSGEEDARRVYRKVERRLAVEGDVVATYAAILSHFRLSATVSPETAPILREANALRNCLLHRGGRVDARAKRDIVSFVVAEGDVLRVSSQMFLRYHEAVSEWLVGLCKSTAESVYFPR